MVAPTRAADVLQHVPPSALGFVVVRDLAATDAKAERLLKTFGIPFPAPLEFLKRAAGVGEGLDPLGQFLLAVLPGEGSADRPPLAVWLPVSDYDRLVGSLDGRASDQPITAVTVAGEDLLIARQGKWALLMDPRERPRMEQFLGAEPQPAAHPAEWRQWIDRNDITAVLLPGGARAILVWIAQAQPSPPHTTRIAVGAIEVEIFGQETSDGAALADGGSPATAGNQPLTILRTWLRDRMSDVPALVPWLAGANATAVGLRGDAEGDVVAGFRIARQPDDSATPSDATPVATPSVPTLLGDGPFTFVGSGQITPAAASFIAGTYARLAARSLATDFQMAIADQAVGQFQEAVERAAATVNAVAMLSRPGDKREGVYTNSFLAVRIASADDFGTHVAEIIRQWNELNSHAPGEVRLQFETGTVDVRTLQATEYSIDVATAIGAPDLPEIRHSMEHLFGPGGKARLLVVPVDEHTVLLAAATVEQATGALELLQRDAAAVPERDDLRAANCLLPDAADWRLYVSPHGYTTWLRRQMEAMLGPVIGGPLVKEFAPSPPIGVAGGTAQHEWWFEIAAPAATIEATAAFLQN